MQQVQVKGIKNQLRGLFDRALAMRKGKVRGITTKEEKILELMLRVADLYQEIGNLASISGNTYTPRSLRDIFQECLDRYEEADAQYGEFDPLSDQRNLVREAQEELSDEINYLGFMLIKAYTQFALSGTMIPGGRQEVA